MRVYVDSSAALKRVVPETESVALVEALDQHVRDANLIVSSTLAWIEVARALRSRFGQQPARVAADVDAALSGIAEHPMSAEVASVARRLGPDQLRSLDAIHLASALVLDTDLMVTYDHRLADACVANGLRVSRPA